MYYLKRWLSKLSDCVKSKELVAFLFNQAYGKIVFLANQGIAKPQPAGDYLEELGSFGILKNKQAGQKILYLDIRLYNLLSTTKAVNCV